MVLRGYSKLCVQKSHLAVLDGSYVMLRIKVSLATFKTRTLNTVSLGLHVSAYVGVCLCVSICMNAWMHGCTFVFQGSW